MAHRQVVLLACDGDYITSPIRLQPDFRAISVSKLGMGDKVWLQLESRGSPTEVKDFPLQPGLTPFPDVNGSTHLRIRKQAGSFSLPTTVEIHRGS